MNNTTKHILLKNVTALLIITFVLIPFLFSCKKETETKKIDVGYDYFPTTIGKYIVYDVDSIVYNDFSKSTDTFNFQIKEINQSSFLDNTNRPSVRIERYKKKHNDTIAYSAMNWTLQDVWYSTRTATRAEKIEENVRYVKLVFPTENNKIWNGNAFNTIGEWDFKYEDVNEPKTVGTIFFNSTASVLRLEDADQNNLLNTNYYYEVYAKNYGMVYKEITTIQYDSIHAYPRGLEYRMTVHSVGP